MKTHEVFFNWLKTNNACDPSISWVIDNKLSSKEAWYTCHRGDWLLWWAKKENCDLRVLTLANGKCAATVVHLMKDQRSKAAVTAAIDFGEGLITRKQLDASYAADAAAYVDAYATAAYAAAENQKVTADIVRSIIKPTWL